ncbi:hypothetical protein WJX75_000043 [Coccomyxa subellipsoidea]|uniref:HIG1 domain-containing protein n=1 Tax=Coccomyxa subellipsoidea TaxID=248742 RepID=A0ABR2Z298_9CHLO
MDANTSTCTDTRLAFDLAEAIPSTSLDSHQHLAPWKERLSPSRWLRRRSTAVTAFSVIRCREDWKDILVKTSSAARQQLADLAHPKGPGTCDHNAAERGINILTSLPFFALGWQAYRQGKSEESRLWGASIMGVGAGAVAFHASSGNTRHWGRKLDYWVISLSTAALTRAVYPKVSSHKTAASLLLTPMQPLAVTSLNAAAMELEFLKQARKNPELRPAHRLHMATTVLGAGPNAWQRYQTGKGAEGLE